MRQPLDRHRIQEILRELGRAAKGPGKVFLTGGSTALLFGWRNSTVDIDIKLHPEPPGIFQALQQLKRRMKVSIELAAPDQFLPPVPGWEERSVFIDQFGPVSFFHYDLRSQALSKLSRGHQRDLVDVAAMFEHGLVRAEDLRSALEAIDDQLIRYPHIEPAVLRQSVESFLEAR